MEGVCFWFFLDEFIIELVEVNGVDEIVKLNGYESVIFEESDSDDDSEIFEDVNDGNFLDGVVDFEDMGG